MPKPGTPATGKPTAGATPPSPRGVANASGSEKAVPGGSGSEKPPAKPAPATGADSPPPSAAGKPARPNRPASKPAVPASKRKPAPVKPSQSTKTTGRRIGQVFIDLGYIDENQLWELLDDAKNSGKMLGQAAIARGLITELQLFQALADQYGLRLLSADELKPAPEALAVVPEPMSTVYKVLPLSYREGILTVAMGDVASLQSMDDLRGFIGCKEVVATLAFPAAIAEVLAKCYLGKEETIMDIIHALQTDDEAQSGHSEKSIDLENLMEEADAAPVRKLLNMVMLLAIKDRASDIHFEPFEDEFKMRYRCDGVMYEMVPPPRHLANAISTRIKVMSNLDIAERRLPQDGRIELNVGGNTVDLRVSILPTMFGESAVLRVLDRGNVGLDLNRLGFEPEMLAQMREIIQQAQRHLPRAPGRPDRARRPRSTPA